MPWWQQPFFQVALPVMITFILATWYQSARINDVVGRINDLRDSLGKRIDDLRADMINRIDSLRADMNNRFGSVEKRLDRLEAKVDALQERVWR